MKTIAIFIALIVVVCAFEDKVANKGDFHFTILGAGNQPKYHFSYQDTQKYQLEFSRLYECDDAGEIVPGVGHLVAMPSLVWEMSENVDEDGGFKFNMTGTGEAWFNSIRIQNHLRNDHIKFDFIMTGMQWTSDTNKLCMEYRFHSNGKNDDPSSTKQSGDGDDAKDEAELDGAEFSSVKLAEQNNGTISHIQTRMMAKNGHILVQYDHFDTDVVHDPTLIANSGAWYLLPSALFAVLVLLF